MVVREVVTELIRKECESYRLVDWKLLPSVEEGVEALLPEIGAVDGAVWTDYERFRIWRAEVLEMFYRQLDYAGFLQENASGMAFRRFLFALKKRIVARLHEQCQEPTIDRELAVRGKTLAFKLSACLDDILFSLERPRLSSVGTPVALEGLCLDSCRKKFPLDMEDLLDRLEADDPAFWDELYLKVGQMAEAVMSGLWIPALYRVEILQGVWSDVSVLLHGKVTKRDTPQFETALHFRNYMGRMCLLKCREEVRKWCDPEMELTQTGEMPAVPCEPDEAPALPDVLVAGLDGMDCDNEEERKRALAIILWDRLEPWYTELVKGIEEKAELIFLHYVEGLPYEEIARRKDSGGTEKERIRMANKLRQDVVRTRKVLQARFKDLLRKEGKI